MLELSAAARQQFAALARHYGRKKYDRAIPRLINNLEYVSRQILAGKQVLLKAPRPYKSLETHGLSWAKYRGYWIAINRADPPVIVAVFHESADIPAWIGKILSPPKA